ncbi:MAG: zinc ribbon domain-containing protein [Oscillospiraceae bacterium]|nr:zinc ribbon domain-containing protein [Oscillospiraceae bacterium]
MDDIKNEAIETTQMPDERICPKCGAANPYTQIFCGKCGCNMNKGERKPLNIKIIIGIAAGLIVVIAAILIIVLNNTPQKRFQRAVENNNYSKAVEIYSRYSGDTGFKALASTSVKKKAGELVSSFAAGEINKDQLDTIISTVSNIYDFSNEAQQITELNDSKQAWDTAEAYKQQQDYFNAIGKYAEVIAEDTEHYTETNSKIEECKELYSSHMIELANEEISANKSEQSYIKAKQLLENAVSTGFANDAVIDRIDSIEAERKDFICSEAIDKAKEKESPIDAYKILVAVNESDRTEQLNNSISEYAEAAGLFFADKMKAYKEDNDYTGAFSFYKKLTPDIQRLSGIKSVYSTFRSDYVKAVLAQAKKSADEGKYSNALYVVEKALENCEDADLTSKRKEYQKEIDVSYLKSAKNYFVRKDYDDIYSRYWIIPYSTNYWQDYGSKYTIRPELYISDKNYLAFELSFGFTRSTWIFTDTIIVDCDGRQFRYYVGYSERETNVDHGDIQEVWYAEDKNSTLLFNDVNTANDFSALIEAMESAKAVKVRFSGSKGHIDKTLPQAEINRITVYWRVYQILLRDPLLKTYVIQ